MKKEIDYHSALGDELHIEEGDDFYIGKIAFVHDINDGVHYLFRYVDCIYSEPSWLNGYPKFLERAGVESKSFNEYKKNILSVIKSINKPSFIIMGKHMVKTMNPDYSYDIKLNGGNSVLGVYNYNNIPIFERTEQLLEYISDRFDVVLDFCCGYGTTFNYFDRFVASDINKKCINYINKKYL